MQSLESSKSEGKLLKIAKMLDFKLFTQIKAETIKQEITIPGVFLNKIFLIYRIRLGRSRVVSMSARI